MKAEVVDAPNSTSGFLRAVPDGVVWPKSKIDKIMMTWKFKKVKRLIPVAVSTEQVLDPVGDVLLDPVGYVDLGSLDMKNYSSFHSFANNTCNGISGKCSWTCVG